MLIQIISSDESVSAINIAYQVYAKLYPALYESEGFDDLLVSAEDDKTFVLQINRENKKRMLNYISELKNEFDFSVKILTKRHS